MYRAYDGVIDWMGASINPYRKVLIANANDIPFIVSLQPRGPAVAAGKVKPWDRQGKEPKTKDDLAPMYGTPYVGKVEPWLNPLGVPCNPPPWGTLTAIDLVTRQIVWQHPLGTTRDTGPFGTHTNLPLPTGIFNIGGNLITRGGLIFIGATADNYLRAIDETTGKVVWKTRTKPPARWSGKRGCPPVARPRRCPMLWTAVNTWRSPPAAMADWIPPAAMT